MAFALETILGSFTLVVFTCFGKDALTPAFTKMLVTSMSTQ